MILVEGSLRNNNYQDRNHPEVTHYTMDVFVDNVEFCGDKGSNSGNNNSLPAPSPAQNLVNQAQNASIPTDLSDFEEILSDGAVPF